MPSVIPDSKSFFESNKALALAMGVLLLCDLIVWRGVVKSVLSPLVEEGDTATVLYTFQYLSDNLRWFPWPHLNLVNDQGFYPYGVNQCFQSWVLERDLFVSLMTRLFGLAGWHQVYFLLSLMVGSTGILLLLKRDFGLLRALAVAVLAIFCNFHAFQKYPAHLCYSTVSWMTLNVVMDYLLLYRVVENKPISLRLVLLRGLCLVLLLGQEPAYITTLTLTALLISQAALWLLILCKTWKASAPNRGPNRGQNHGQSRCRWVRSFITNLFARWREEAVQKRWSCLLIVTLGLLAAWVYVPILAQISLNSKQLYRQAMQGAFQIQDGSPIFGENSPWRLLLPFFPGFSPVQTHGLITDMSEAVGAGSVGWAILLTAILGCVMSWRKWPLWLPTIVTIALLASYKQSFPVLQIFPWASFLRVAGRGALLYAPLLALLSLGIDWNRFSKNTIILLTCGWILLGLVETHTAWSMQHRDRPVVLYTQDMANYMQRIANEPGEALLDWPFCIAGGNGIGTGQLGPYYFLNAHLYAYHALHGKKVVGCYFGRLYPQMFMPQVLAGWEDMFMPNAKIFGQPNRQSRTFDQTQWQFFTRFLELGDFAGINLCVDLLAPGDEQNFYQHFGQPVAQTTLPGVGRVAFIPKPASLRGHVDLNAAKNLKLDNARTMKLNGSLRLEAGLTADAIPFLQRAVELQPDNAQFHNNLAIALARTGQPAKAVEHFQKALQLDPGNPQFRSNLLRAQAASKQP